MSKISRGAASLLAAAKRTYEASQVHAIPSKVVTYIQKGVSRIIGRWVPDQRGRLRLRDRVAAGWDKFFPYLRSCGSRISRATSVYMAGISTFGSGMNVSMRRVGTSITNTLTKAGRSLRLIIKGLAEKFAHGRKKIGRNFVLWPSQKDRVRGSDMGRVFEARPYPGSRDRKYLIHVPPSYTGKTAVPLVMVLHGCGQTHRDIQTTSDFDAVSDRAGFLVVYPFLTSRGRYLGMGGGNCWGWWLCSEIRSGAGEVEDLWQIIEEIKRDYNVDPRRIHVTGLSSGAGMTVAMLVAHTRRIASGAPVAGVPYSETPRAVKFLPLIPLRYKSVPSIVSAMQAELEDTAEPMPIYIVHSHDDATVDIMAARNLRDSWAQCFRIDLSDKVKIGRGSLNGTQWKHTRYWGDDRRPTIETLFLRGPGHGWYGGQPGKHSYPDAPRISELIWHFFSRHPLPATRMAAPLRDRVPQKI